MSTCSTCSDFSPKIQSDQIDSCQYNRRFYDQTNLSALNAYIAAHTEKFTRRCLGTPLT